jgi:hypothetical protein
MDIRSLFVLAAVFIPPFLHLSAADVFEHLNLASVTTMAFADEQGYDGRGGWFDQGPQNDLSGFPTGECEMAGVSFDVIDPAVNNGKSVLVLAGSERPFLPRSATIKVNSESAHGYLYVLHSAGWLPPGGNKIGRITVIYRDGTSTARNVVSGEDIADWFNAYDLKNASVAWTKPARAGQYGVYVSEFPTENKPIAAVTFSSERNAVWAVIGATLTATRIGLPKQVRTVTEKGAEWRPFKEYPDVVPGSALDFSGLLDAPAGKYGRLVVRDGHFNFENAPDKRVRFYGTNLCYSANFPTHEEAARLATNLASLGYNVVRFHHYDDMLTQNGKDSTTPDPELLDRMEYLMAECEKRGMYLVIDLYSFRQTREGEIPEIQGTVRAGFKCLPPVLDSAMTLWKRFAHNIMTHVNPYTGKTLAENPALVGICPVNEDPLGTVWHDSPAVADFYNKLLTNWKAAHDINPAGWDEEQAATSRFLNEIQLKGDQMYADYLRNELHAKAPLTGANCLVAISLTEPRSHYDYVDNHIYWDHPEFPAGGWQLPYRYHQMSSIEAMAYVPRTLFPSRIKGRPFTVTEWNYCNPNRFRAEGAALMTAYASLQDWDGLYRFAHSHNIENVRKASASNGFDLATDPICQVTERVGALMFLRGDIAPAKGFVSVAVDSANAYRVISGWGSEGFEEPLELLGLCTGVGSVWAEGLAPSSITGPISGSVHFSSNPGYVAPDASLFDKLETEGVIPQGSIDLARGVFKSETGELSLNAKAGTFVISTPRGEWFIANKAAKLKGATASMSVEKGPATVAVASLDGLPLAESAHMLVVHVTEQANSGEVFTNADMRMLENWGGLPHLMRAGRATLDITTSKRLTAYALDLSGKRLRKVAVTKGENCSTIILDNSKGKEAILAYELVGE